MDYLPPIDADLCSVLMAAREVELDMLVACIKRKLTQRFTHSAAYLDYHAAQDKDSYRQAYVERMAQSICNLGGHGIANAVRGFKGPRYERILRSLAKRMHLKYPKDTPVESLELAVLGTELGRMWRRLDDQQRDLWMMQQLLHWTQSSAISPDQLQRLSTYFDEQPRHVPIDDLLDGLKDFCVRELDKGEVIYLQFVHCAFSCILLRLTPRGIQMELHSSPQDSCGCDFSLLDLMGARVPRTINSPSLLGLFRLWLRSPASPMPTASHDPNSGLWRFLGNMVHLQPSALFSGGLLLPLMPTLAVAAAGTVVTVATRPSDRVLRPVVLVLACIRLRQLRS